MTENDLNETYGPRLAELFGNDYRNDPRYHSIVQQVVHGSRDVRNAILDYAEVSSTASKSGW